MPQELLGELVRDGRAQRPSRLALVWRDQQYSYLTLDAEIDRVAENLLTRKVAHGDRIALYMHNLPQFVIALYALQRIGAVVVPINIYWKGRDLRHLLETSQVTGIITIGPLYDRVKEVQESLPAIKWVVVYSGGGGQPAGTLAWEDLSTGQLPGSVYIEADAIDPALIAFTGGRTGPSRPVVLSHFNLLANCQQMQDLARVKFLGDQEEEERRRNQTLPAPGQQEIALLPLPLFNLFSLNVGLNLTYMLGGTAVLMERFDPEQALELVESQGCTVIFGSPAIFTELVNAPGFPAAKLGSLRYVFSYGAPLPTATSQTWQEKTGQPIFNCYGVTEASPLLCCEAAGEKSSPDTVGPSLPMVQLEIRGPQGEALQPHEVGEIVAKGPNMLLGYFDPTNPDAPTADRADGWFATGDLGLVDEAGNYQVLDRLEDTLALSNGELIVPRDIERVLCDHPGVWDAAALPHSVGDRNRMVAFVVLKEEGRNLTEQQLMHFCENRLPIRVCPERIFLYRDDDLLRLPNGAIWRRALRAQIPDYL